MAPDHYCCHRVYVPKTQLERISQAVKKFPHKTKVPQITTAELATDAAHCLIDVLKNPAPNAPFVACKESTAVALDRLSANFLATAAPFQRYGTSKGDGATSKGA